MPKITVDGKIVEAKDRQMILQACLDGNVELPYYCYHPGLSIVASCRICLVEVEGIPKLVPSCQTPVRDGMVVHTRGTKVIHSGILMGDAVNEGGRLYVDAQAQIRGKVKTHKGETKIEPKPTIPGARRRDERAR